MKYYAHSTKNPTKIDWQELKIHLENTANKCAKFAGKFNHEEFGRIAGLFHDLGKYSEKFQKRLSGSSEKVDHATAGAIEVSKIFSIIGENILAYCIAGHHGGLPDAGTDANDKSLTARLKKEVEKYSHYVYELSEEDLKANFNLQFFRDTSPFAVSFFTRMLYSGLVDADWLDTEEFCENGKIIRSDFESLEILNQKLLKYLKKFEGKTSKINKKRNEILQQCMRKAKGTKGLYSLTVPTGGGKTLSSLAFALTHAIENGQDRVIYAIPYTSIIEQNANIFRDIFDEENVLEHHSNYIFEEKEDDEDQTTSQKLKYASENWDAPIIATTNVQFFESLFANKKSKCRKLHNIANSVIILDEAQMIPIKYLIPCAKALDELVNRYNCTIVLCTATQPPMQKYFSSPIQEIMPNPKELFDFFKRVDVKHIGKISDDDLISEISGLNQVLTIVNTKKHARALYEKMIEVNCDKQEGIYHLSTLMCPCHRKSTLKEIKDRLEKKLPVKVFSTQLIEAGVDIDFPYVYRSAAGLDSIAQSAGRCNREGKLENLGVVKVFESLEKYGMPHGNLKQPAQVGKDTIGKFNDILSTEAIEHYFNELFFYKGDEYLGLSYIKDYFYQSKKGKLFFEFKTAAENFNFIENNTYPVIVPFNEKSRELIEKVKYAEFPKKYLRQLQPYTVNLYESDYMALINKGIVDNFTSDAIAVLLNPEINYDKRSGIVIDKESKALFV